MNHLGKNQIDINSIKTNHKEFKKTIFILQTQY